MKTHEITATGRVTDLFGHRFVLETQDGRMLADLGPKGAEQVKLSLDDEVTLTGERKPSETKVHAITVGGRAYDLRPGAADAEAALAAVRALGFEPQEPPIRKPRHFEILARRGDERLEFHVAFDGAIRKTKQRKPQAPGSQP